MERSPATFDPGRYDDTPLYNIQAVAAASGVPALTLRSWERRYGLPEPKRDEKGYRLYSDRDLAMVVWLKDRAGEGVSIGNAVNMLRTSLAQPPRVSSFAADDLRSRLVAVAKACDEVQVRRVVAEALVVASVEDVCLTIVQPALYEIGELWARGELSVTEKHFASNLLRRQLDDLLQLSPPPWRQRLVVGCAPGELHDIGALMVTLFLRRRGFDVVFVGASVEPNSFIADMRRLGPVAVCLSATRPHTVYTLRDLYRALGRHLGDDFPGLLTFGGLAFHDQPAMIATVPGVYLGNDAREGLAALERALA